MNVMYYLLADGKLESEPSSPQKLTIEDNIGESIHIHLRNIRLEMTVEDFVKFAEKIGDGAEVLQNGNS